MQSARGHQRPRVFVAKIMLAGVKIEADFQSLDDLVCCKGYFSRFTHADFEVYASPEEFANANAAMLDPSIKCDFGNIVGAEALVIQQKIVNRLIWHNTFLMHGSVVALNNHAYMFTAPSGTGKTTRTRLWLEEYPSSIVVNGDKPLIKVTDTDILACGTPWCGKEGWNTNTMVPLRAIFLLERADENSIEEISLGKAFPTLLQQTHRPADPAAMRKTIELLKALEGKVKIYRFRSTPTHEAVRLAYETARPQQGGA